MFYSFLLVFFCMTAQAVPVKKIVFATSADYPPFEYFSNGELKGFDVDLAKALAQELQAECSICDMNFSSILTSVDAKACDAGIACCSATPERAERYDFTDEYHRDDYAVIVQKGSRIQNINDLENKHVAVQVGSTMALWLKSKTPKTKRALYDSNIMAVESLRSGKVDCVLVERSQAEKFCANNQNLDWKTIGRAEQGFAVLLPKGSPLKDPINAALKKLKQNGTLDAIKKKYLG